MFCAKWCSPVTMYFITFYLYNDGNGRQWWQWFCTCTFHIWCFICDQIEFNKCLIYFSVCWCACGLGNVSVCLVCGRDGAIGDLLIQRKRSFVSPVFTTIFLLAVQRHAYWMPGFFFLAFDIDSVHLARGIYSFTWSYAMHGTRINVMKWSEERTWDKCFA